MEPVDKTSMEYLTTRCEWTHEPLEVEARRRAAARARAGERRKPFVTHRVDAPFGTVLEPPAWAEVNQHLVKKPQITA